MSDAFPEEVRYYFPGAGVNAPPVQSVFPGDGTVPVNYGGFYVEAMDSHGGWVSSTIDLLRFLTAVDGRPNRPDILSGPLVAEMTSNGYPVCAGGACYYAGGWMIRPTQGDANWWHGGSLPGTTSMLVRSYHNYSWVALFNARSNTGTFDGELDAALWKALAGVTSFPTHDLFSSFR
jgi:N-acyl-D-amino-acid deacylase